MVKLLSAAMVQSQTNVVLAFQVAADVLAEAVLFFLCFSCFYGETQPKSTAKTCYKQVGHRL